MFQNNVYLKLLIIHVTYFISCPNSFTSKGLEILALIIFSICFNLLSYFVLPLYFNNLIIIIIFFQFANFARRSFIFFYE